QPVKEGISHKLGEEEAECKWRNTGQSPCLQEPNCPRQFCYRLHLQHIFILLLVLPKKLHLLSTPPIHLNLNCFNVQPGIHWSLERRRWGRRHGRRRGGEIWQGSETRKTTGKG
ncbi:Os06g0179950, partial [Oryza sativa Japonica Group]